MFKKSKIGSPLRYPGGKSKALKQIIPMIPAFKEFREPFVGGGSVFFELKQRNSEAKFWINDLNTDLYFFWHFAQIQSDELVYAVNEIKKQYTDGRELYNELVNTDKEFTPFERAVRFFVLNRITFSGTVESGGYSQQAFDKRFTDSSIKRLASIKDVIQNTLITNYDYEEVVNAPGEDVFIFLDPPYLSATSSKLYGKKGDLHLQFDHERFAEVMKKCEHKWLITYDDSEKIRELFSFANIYTWELQYGMNNYKQESAAKGKELFIGNFPV